jgi:hypothetical protein
VRPTGRCSASVLRARSDRPVSDGDEIRDYETRLRRAGLPLLIEDYSAREDVFS